MLERGDEDSCGELLPDLLGDLPELLPDRRGSKDASFGVPLRGFSVSLTDKGEGEMVLPFAARGRVVARDGGAASSEMDCLGVLYPLAVLEPSVLSHHGSPRDNCSESQLVRTLPSPQAISMLTSVANEWYSVTPSILTRSKGTQHRIIIQLSFSRLSLECWKKTRLAL